MSNTPTPERAQIPARYRWKTSHLFRNDKAWRREHERLRTQFEGITACQGQLGRSRKTALTCLDRLFEAHRLLARLANYAHRKYDQDTRVGRYQGLREVIDRTATDFASVTAFIQPELLALPDDKLDAMLADRRFADYEAFLREIVRLKPHILPADQEGLLAATGRIRDAPYTVYSAFSAADLTFPPVRDEEGNEAELTQSSFSRFRRSPDRRVRCEAFEQFFGTYRRYQNTLAALLSAQVGSHITVAEARHYDSALQAALDRDALPTAVYHTMIKAIDRHLPLLHRYLDLRRRLLGLDQLHYHDLYPPMLPTVELAYTYEEARKLIVQASEPMGEAYVAALREGLSTRAGWVDPMPNQGKRSGAYMDGSAYDVHPYVLSNFIGTYGSVSTIAHEMGHAMHSCFTNRAQPYPKCDYAIFVAEVASTLSEALLIAHLLRTETDPRRRMFFLGEQLEGFRQTLFRQAMFAEFELRLYERAERREPLTAEAITALYLRTVRRTYGHHKGVVLVDETYATEWANVPHFYYNFYVFQYVTGMTAAVALAELIRTEGPPATERYIEHLLSAGGSDQPLALLTRAGVDLTTDTPYTLALGVFARALDEMEELLVKTDR